MGFLSMWKGFYSEWLSSPSVLPEHNFMRLHRHVIAESVLYLNGSGSQINSATYAEADKSNDIKTVFLWIILHERMSKGI